MKPRIVISFIIFLSAYAPLALLFALRDFDSDARWFHHPRFVLCVVITASLSLLCLWLAISTVKGQFSITVNRVALRSNDLIDYTIPYLVSFFGVDFGKWQDVGALGMFIMLLFLLSVTTQSIFINLNEFKKFRIITDVELMRTKIGTRLSYLRKISMIKKNGYYKQKTFLNGVKKVSKEMGWDVRYDGDRIVVTEQNLDLILTLLNNDRLASLINQEIFDVEVKKPVT